jgi:hypothetical protein
MAQRLEDLFLMAVSGKPPASRSGRRPFSRRILKLALSPFSRWSHAYDWLPTLKLLREDSGCFLAAVYKGQTVCALHGARILCEEASGREIFVIGSGPSVATTSFADVTPRSAILLNGACTLIGDRVHNPLAIAIEDERFIWRHFSLLKEKTPAGTIALLSTSVIRTICEIDRHWLAGMRVVLIENVRKPYGRARRSPEELAQIPELVLDGTGAAGFSKRPDTGIFQGGSVAISAVQFAASCKPAGIGLIGIDIGNADQPRFYEKPHDVAPSGIALSRDRILRHVELARSVCMENGIRLRSLSAISLLNQILQDD